MDSSFSASDVHMHNAETFLVNQRLSVVAVQSLSGGATPRNYGNTDIPNISHRSQNRMFHGNFQDPLAITPPPPPMANISASDSITSNISLTPPATTPTPQSSISLCDDRGRFVAWVACFDQLNIQYAPPTHQHKTFDTILAVLLSLRKPPPFENSTFYDHLSLQLTFDDTGKEIESYGITWAAIAHEWANMRAMPKSESDLKGNCRSAFVRVFEQGEDYSVVRLIKRL
ncbi:hypothetical protein VNI00_010314 [Paramarasmius palmivorus]|uniref:Uncharacterized protein n=1 Tax=Paramarasmius palmivorus TaxID=297713 RepID=A0AAW0CIL1_9AGAR